MGIGIEFNNNEEMIKIIDFVNNNDITFKYQNNYLYIAYITGFSFSRDDESYKISVDGFTLYITKDIVDYIGIV